MSKGKELVKNTVIISIGRICTQCVSFFLLPLYTTILSKQEYGTVDLLISYSSLLVPVVTLALEQALFRFLIEVRIEEDRKSEIISTVLAFTLLQCASILAVTTLLDFIITFEYLYLFATMVIASAFSAVMLQLTRGLGDNIGYSLASFLSGATQVLLNCILLVVAGFGPRGMLMASICGNTISASFLFFKTKVYRFFKFRLFDRQLLKRMLKYSLPLIPNQLCWWAMNASDRTFVLLFLGTAYNGLLAVAHKFSTLYISFNNIFNVSWTESASLHINDDDAEDFFTDTIDTAFRLFGCACIGIIACIPFVIHWLVDKSYFDAYYQMPIFMMASLANVVVSLFSPIYVAKKRTKEIASTSFFAALINAGAHLLLINFIGLYAASVSTLLGYGIMAIYRYFHSKKYINARIRANSIISIVGSLVLILVAYYSQVFALNCLALCLAILVSVVLNRKIVLSFAAFAKKRINKMETR